MQLSRPPQIMSALARKKIIVGITGGIAAYKTGELVRRLRDEGAEVRVVMTEGAQAFITPLTFQALSGNPVHTDLLDPSAEAGMGHIELARWPDRVVIAPASASFMARLTHGEAPDLLSTLCLATNAPILLAPAMNRLMWENAATQANLQTLLRRGFEFVGPGVGAQACGETGAGRMSEPADILAAMQGNQTAGLLSGRKVVITAGPTREAIDPVRFISNRSSGKMGFAIASACANAGADVTLVSGPVSLETPHGVRRIEVVSCAQMLAATLDAVGSCDLFVATAAVADYRASAPAANKLKKAAGHMSLELVRNPDILATVAALSARPQLVVGFAAESNNLLEHARDKLQRKALDLIIANDVSRDDSGFESDDNQVWLVDPTTVTELPKMSKSALATRLVMEFGDRLKAH